MADTDVLSTNINIQEASYLQDKVIVMSETSDIEIGTVSSRGQVAIPTSIREKMHLKDGEKILFFLQGDNLLMKKVESMSWSELTEPLVKAKKKLKEEDVVAFVKRVRKE